MSGDMGEKSTCRKSLQLLKLKTFQRRHPSTNEAIQPIGNSAALHCQPVMWHVMFFKTKENL